MSTLLIPVYDIEQLATYCKVAEKMHLVHGARKIKWVLHFELEYDDTIDVFYFGCNVVGEAAGLFKGPLTC